MGNREGLGRRRNRLWVRLTIHPCASFATHFHTLNTTLLAPFFHIPLRPPHLCGQLTDHSCEHVPFDVRSGRHHDVQTHRDAVAVTSPRSATCALLDEFKITATTRSNASRKSHSLYVAPYYMDAMDVIWMKYISHYTTDDIDDIGEIDSHRYTLSSVWLKYPGTMPPGPPKRPHAAARHSHMSTANGVRIVVLSTQGSASSACTHPSLAAVGSKPG